VKSSSTPAAGAPAHPRDADASTRQRVAASVMEHGASTAAVLAERLGLTPAAIRRHLDVLVAAGHVEAREQRVYGSRGRGRPAKVFVLTDSGRAQFYSAYDVLAIQALEFVAANEGPDAVTRFARSRVLGTEERYREHTADSSSPVEALADVLTEEGYVASLQPTASGAQLCQHHCPVAHVATRFPQLCDAETEMFSQLLGVHVQRLATIAHGDGICTTHIPRIDRSPAGTTSRPDALHLTNDPHHEEPSI